MNKNVEKQRKTFDEYRVNINYARYRKVYNFLKKVPKGDLLEIGCCGGEFLELLRTKGWRVKGIEISKKATKRAKAKKLDVRIHDVNKKLPFKDESFDVIFAGELIEHIFDDIEFLNEVHRLLRREGYVIITTPNLLSLKNRILMLFGLDPRYSLSPYHYHVYTQKIISNAFKKSKFKNSKIKGNFIIYSKNREKILGTLFEKLGDSLPSLSEHFIVSAKK